MTPTTASMTDDLEYEQQVRPLVLADLRQHGYSGLNYYHELIGVDASREVDASPLRMNYDILVPAVTDSFEEQTYFIETKACRYDNDLIVLELLASVNESIGFPPRIKKGDWLHAQLSGIMGAISSRGKTYKRGLLLDPKLPANHFLWYRKDDGRWWLFDSAKLAPFGAAFLNGTNPYDYCVTRSNRGGSDWWTLSLLVPAADLTAVSSNAVSPQIVNN